MGERLGVRGGDLEADPAGALSRLANIVERMLRARGYDLDDPVALVGDEPEVMVTYRAARETTERAELGAASRTDVGTAIDDRGLGGGDPGLSVEDVTAFDQALDAAGIEHEVVVYPGAPHSFFDRKHEEFAAASDDAWMRTLAFMARYS